MQLASQRVVEDFVNQRAFAGARDAGDRDKRAERKRDVDVFQVVLAGAFDFETRRQGDRETRR
jgi:hypothetical protein